MNWDSVAQAMSLHLPMDYREFVEIYGGGEMDEYFSISTPPVPGSAYGDLLDGLDPALPTRDLNQLAEQLASNAVPPLLPFGTTAHGDVSFWLREGPADNWNVASFRRQSPPGTARWTVFDGGMVEFCLAFLTGTVEPFTVGSLVGQQHEYVNWRDL